MNRKQNELAVVKKVILAAIKAGYYLNINNGGDTDELEEPTQDVELLMANVHQSDDDVLKFYFNGQKGWVMFVYGNAEDGSEVICDYTTNLDDIVEQFFVDENQTPMQKLL